MPDGCIPPLAGGLPPDSVCEEEPDVLKDMERLINEFHDNEKCAELLPKYSSCMLNSVGVSGHAMHQRGVHQLLVH
jgi:hypothetical protein